MGLGENLTGRDRPAGKADEELFVSAWGCQHEVGFRKPNQRDRLVKLVLRNCRGILISSDRNGKLKSQEPDVQVGDCLWDNNRLPGILGVRMSVRMLVPVAGDVSMRAIMFMLGRMLRPMSMGLVAVSMRVPNRGRHDPTQQDHCGKQQCQGTSQSTILHRNTSNNQNSPSNRTSRRIEGQTPVLASTVPSVSNDRFEANSELTARNHRFGGQNRLRQHDDSCGIFDDSKECVGRCGLMAMMTGRPAPTGSSIRFPHGACVETLRHRPAASPWIRMSRPFTGNSTFRACQITPASVAQRTPIDNPRLAANLKAKKLRELLDKQKAAQKKGALPFLEALVFCSAPDLCCELQDNARYHVCLRDRAAAGNAPARPGIMAAIKRRECPALESHAKGIYDRPMAKIVSQAMEQAGIQYR